MSPYIVYFLQRANGDIKIGTTTESGYARRLAQLTAEHGELTLLGIVYGSRRDEYALHRRFQAYRRIRLRLILGAKRSWDYVEFFEPAEELTTFIRANAQPYVLKRGRTQGKPESRHAVRGRETSQAFLSAQA